MTDRSPSSEAARDAKRKLVRAALAAGASAVAVARATDDAETRERMRAAFARGDFATWPYGETYAERASSPHALESGAQSVICLAVAYATPPPAARPPLTGRVSNYAWSADYHEHVRRIARTVAAAADALAETPGASIACDYAPLGERALAARAGLAWVGKHTGAIVPRLGSYVFLAEVLTPLVLEPDVPLQKTCGTCARCVTVCPTGALRGDYTMDATRCIADLTQRTDGIPRAWRTHLGDWVWGCDLCQEACPPTRLAGHRGGAAFAPRGSAAAFPDLTAMLRLRSAAFRRTFAPLPMGWRGAAVLRRNAAVGLGNALDRSAVKPLAAALEEDPHPMVRGHVAWALGRIGSPAALAALRGRLAAEADAAVREEIEQALLSWETFGTTPALKSRRNSPG